MRSDHLEELIKLDDAYWWHLTKRRLVIDLLERHFPPPGNLLEGGVGAGGNLRAFQKMGYATTGYDVMPEAVEHCRRSGLANVRRHAVDEPWPVEPSSQDVVVFLDLLEHLDEPARALRNAWTALRVDGGLIVSVPAYQWLMGPWDRSLGHRRRYDRVTLRGQVEAEGFQTSRWRYWNLCSLPPALVIRLYEKTFKKSRAAEFPKIPFWLNKLLLSACELERVVAPFCFLDRAGLSIIGVFTKST